MLVNLAYPDAGDGDGAGELGECKFWIDWDIFGTSVWNFEGDFCLVLFHWVSSRLIMLPQAEGLLMLRESMGNP